LFCAGLLYSFNFQYPKREVYFFSTFFHDFIVIGLVFIVVYVGCIFYFSISRSVVLKKKNSLEIYLMVFPILFLLFLRVPSMLLLQKKGGEFSNSEDIYVDASQWFWEYRTSSIPRFVSSLCKSCLDTWHKLEPKLPICLKIGFKKFFFFRNDVIHSFALPRMGIKVDCVPGLLSSLERKFLSPGIFYGQCRELCGVNHSFMPIEVEVVYSKKGNEI